MTMADFTNRPTVVGVFDDRRNADEAVEDLRDAGFREDQIGYLAHGKLTGQSTRAAGESERATHAGEGAAAGAVVGGILGAAAALLIPGIGPIVAGGVLASVAVGAAVGAAAGGLVGTLVGLGISEEEALYYDEEFRRGRTLVTVRAEGRYLEAQEILRRNTAYDIENRPAEPMSTDQGDQVTIPVERTMSSGTSTRTTNRSQDQGTRSTVVQDDFADNRNGEAKVYPEDSPGATVTWGWSRVMPSYRSRWQGRYAPSGGSWEEVAPYYEYGYQAWNDPRYHGRGWSEVATDVQRGWEAKNPNTPWEMVSQYVQDVWDNPPT